MLTIWSFLLLKLNFFVLMYATSVFILYIHLFDCLVWQQRSLGLALSVYRLLPVDLDLGPNLLQGRKRRYKCAANVVISVSFLVLLNLYKPHRLCMCNSLAIKCICRHTSVLGTILQIAHDVLS